MLERRHHMSKSEIKSKEKLFKHMKLMVLLCILPLFALYSVPFIKRGNMGLVALIFLMCPVVHGGMVWILERKSKE